jgi:hypothetical protein
VLAWALFALVLLLFATYPLLDRVVRDAGRPDLALFAPFVVAPTLAALTASTVGWVLASRRPRHPVGWLLLTLGLSMAVGGAIAGYLPYTTIVRPDALPAAGLLARIYAPVTDLALASLGLVLLLTPTGSAPSPGWRRWAFASSAAMAALAVAATVAPGSVDARVLSIEGPVGPHAFGGALAVFNQLALATALLIILGGAGSLVTRYRRARGLERQQLRWVTLAAALTGVAMLATGVLVAVGNLALAGWASVFGTVFLPLATGAAILRYRLYDLDRIISRTLAYGLLTVLLGGGYVLVVLGLGQLLGRDSSLVVAAATWPWPPSSSRPAAASSRPSTGASTAAATTRPGSSRGSGTVCGRRSTWTPSPPRCWGWPSRPCSRPGRRCGCDHRPGRASSEPGSVAVVVAAA